MNKQRAHQLLDRLDPSQLDAVARLLEVMTDPETAPIRSAPVDDEPVTDDEERAVAASKEWFKNNRGIPMEEVAAELGLTMEQVRGHQALG
jgi:predicted transcriptional regulator